MLSLRPEKAQPKDSTGLSDSALPVEVKSDPRLYRLAQAIIKRAVDDLNDKRLHELERIQAIVFIRNDILVKRFCEISDIDYDEFMCLAEDKYEEGR